MKSRISALMDGELERGDESDALKALAADGEARDAWRTYHLISDALRDTRLLTGSFAERVAARLADEPTVIAPGRLAPAAGDTRRFALSAAAGVAAVALVGWLAFAPQQPSAPAPQLARSAQPAATPQSAPAPQLVQSAQPAAAPQSAPAPQALAAAPKEAAQVAPPSAADDYLLAHQAYSPRNSLQGVAPYVRTVSGAALAGKK
jgi:sigma-E factor negative regulatory protein RseA